MVTGSVASMLYGEPRLTLDVDVVVALDVGRASELLAAFPEAEFYRPPLEVVRLECSRDARGHFNPCARHRKLEFWREGGSEKHLRDLRAMLAADLELDREFLEAELRSRGLEQAWQRVVAREE